MNPSVTTTPAPHYHLRFQIIPGPRVARDARALARCCRRHGIEEVVLIFAGKDWNNGLLSAREPMPCHGFLVLAWNQAFAHAARKETKRSWA